ncbi:protein canopy homolog 2-like isoform X2 [Physella acuta]|nr:protein canopy homolog 2-like isoform X2 [Physella acuta]XP_059151200.1 protein canopy homolog 2-like isoform X2 [Physella acuta]
MLVNWLFSFVVFILVSGTVIQGQKNYCTVCRVLVREVEWLISQVDPKKSIQVGSFRVDPNGNQKIKDKQYARSELHLEEVVESVCEKMNYYSWLAFDDGTGQMVRTTGFDGKQLDKKNLNLDSEKGKTLKYQCDDFLENHEEELISLFQLENVSDYEKLICSEKLEVCTKAEVQVPPFTLPELADTPENNDDMEVLGGVTPDDDDDDVDVDADENDVNDEL